MNALRRALGDNLASGFGGRDWVPKKPPIKCCNAAQQNIIYTELSRSAANFRHF